jgi:superfamily I DNA/RNA helicase
MRLAINREDSLAWATLLHLAGGIGATFIDYIYDCARDARSTFGRALLAEFGNGFVGAPRSSGRAAPIIESAIKWVEEHPIPEQTPEDGWANWISDALPAGGTAEITGEFRQLLSNVDERIETDDLGNYLSQVGPLARDLALARSDGVRIMTLAGSKGLTVEAAILCGLESGLVPMDGADLAEERRLLYVGMTRAKRFLFGTWARLEQIPLRFEHSLHGERSSCTLLPRNRKRSVRSGAIDAEWCARRPCAGQPSLC